MRDSTFFPSGRFICWSLPTFDPVKKQTLVFFAKIPEDANKHQLENFLDSGESIISFYQSRKHWINHMIPYNQPSLKLTARP